MPEFTRHIPLTYPVIRAILRPYILAGYVDEGVMMEQGAIFLSNRSQAIRLPKAVALPEDVKRVDVVAIGRVRIITPVGEAWDSWFDGPGPSADFMAERDQPAEQEREAF
jgi:antitoxin VapB